MILKIKSKTKNLASKIQSDNSNVKQHLKDKSLMLEACQKEYQKIYFEHENLKKKYQQFEEQLKQQQQQQRLIKKLLRHIKNKKCYFITDNSEDYDENINDCENENDDQDDNDDNEVKYIKVKNEKQKKTTFGCQKKAKRKNGLYK